MQHTHISVLAAPFALATLAVAPLVTLVVACGSDSTGTSGPASSATASASATTTATGTSTTAAVARKLVEGHLLPTSPGNLLVDPGFGQLSSQTASYGSWFGGYTDDNSQFVPQTTLDSRSPAGFSGNVAVMLAAMATDTKSRGIQLITSVLGGPGPYHASIWVSKSNVAGQPIDWTPDKTFSISLATDYGTGPGASKAKVYALVPDPTPLVASNGRAWIHFQVDVTDPLPDGAFVLIGTGAKGGAFQLAAPEVTSATLEQQLSTMSRVVTQPRDLTDEERAFIKRYKSLPRQMRKPEVQKIRGE